MDASYTSNEVEQIAQSVDASPTMIVDRGLYRKTGMAATHGMTPLQLVSMIKVVGDEHTLDLGAGEGNFLADLERKDLHIRAIDARPKGKRADIITRGAFSNMPFNDNAFRLLLASRSFGHYSANVTQFIKEISEVERITMNRSHLYLTCTIDTKDEWIINKPKYIIEQYCTEIIYELRCTMHNYNLNPSYLCNIPRFIERHSSFRFSNLRVCNIDIENHWFELSMKFLKHSEA